MKKIFVLILMVYIFNVLIGFGQDIKQPKELRQVCDISCNENVVSWELYYEIAVYHFYNAEHELALYFFQKALELNDKEIKIYPYIIYALCSFEGGQRGLTPGKNLRTPFYSREAYGKNENAEKIFETYLNTGLALASEKLRINSNDDEARFYLGMLYVAAANFKFRIKGEKLEPKNDVNRAVEEFRIILANKNSKYYYSAMAYLGGLNYMFGKINWFIRIFLGNIPKDKEMGLKMLKEAYENESNNNDIAFFYFSALYVEQKYVEARKIVVKLIDLYPMNFDLREYLVFLDIKLGRFNEARATIDIALRDLKIMKGQRYRFFEKEFKKALQYLDNNSPNR